MPLDLTSLGSKQVFPILLALFTRAALHTGGAVLTEEREISLHPRAQVEVGEWFAKFVNAGVQLIFTTYSHYMLLGILKAVRQGVLSASAVAILHCVRNEGGNQVTLLLMDQYGRIDGGIPSFADVNDYIFEQWIQDIPRDN